MRLFTALNPSENDKDIIEKYIIRLRQAGAVGNFSRRENLHITLAFLGETDRLGEAAEAMENTVTEPFVYRLSALGRFKGYGKGDTVFLGVEDDSVMKKLASSLSDKLREKGFKLESRSFKAHLTIGREIYGYEKIRDISIPGLVISAGEMSLMKSERIRGRLTYTPVYVKNL